MVADRKYGLKPGEKHSWLIVDGYNIIGDWDELRDLSQKDIAAARDHLADTLLDYCGHTGQNLLLVFDAHSGTQGERSQLLTEAGLHRLVYTGRGQTADQYIERFVREVDGELYVASSDGLIQVMIASHASRLSAQDLRKALHREEEKRAQRYIEQSWKKAGLGTLLDKEAIQALEKLRQGLYDDPYVPKENENTSEDADSMANTVAPSPKKRKPRNRRRRKKPKSEEAVHVNVTENVIRKGYDAQTGQSRKNAGAKEEYKGNGRPRKRRNGNESKRKTEGDG